MLYSGAAARRATVPVDPEWQPDAVVDDPPVRLQRPLALIGGRAYAATWLLTRMRRELPSAAPRTTRALRPVELDKPRGTRGPGRIRAPNPDSPRASPPGHP